MKPPTQQRGQARASRLSCIARDVPAVRMDGESAMWACVRNGGDYTDPPYVGYAIMEFFSGPFLFSNSRALDYSVVQEQCAC